MNTRNPFRSSARLMMLILIAPVALLLSATLMSRFSHANSYRVDDHVMTRIVGN